jgi:hypothetical protein
MHPTLHREQPAEQQLKVRLTGTCYAFPFIIAFVVQSLIPTSERQAKKGGKETGFVSVETAF